MDYGAWAIPKGELKVKTRTTLEADKREFAEKP
jgi:predicted NUDIX family NTP pyrophosphohydrolase